MTPDHGKDDSELLSTQLTLSSHPRNLQALPVVLQLHPSGHIWRDLRELTGRVQRMGVERQTGAGNSCWDTEAPSCQQREPKPLLSIYKAPQAVEKAEPWPFWSARAKRTVSLVSLQGVLHPWGLNQTLRTLRTTQIQLARKDSLVVRAGNQDSGDLWSTSGSDTDSLYGLVQVS